MAMTGTGSVVAKMVFSQSDTNIPLSNGLTPSLVTWRNARACRRSLLEAQSGDRI